MGSAIGLVALTVGVNVAKVEAFAVNPLALVPSAVVKFVRSTPPAAA